MDNLDLAEIEERYPLHWHVWHRNVDQLRQGLASKLHDVDALDPRGRSPLNLAAARGTHDCAAILLEAGADPNLSNKEGWDALQEAVGCAQPELLAMLMQHKEFQRLTRRNGSVVDILNSLEQTDDFYLEMKWEFSSWVPFVSRMCPSDTYKIYKSGANVRVDTTLLGFDQMNWQRGNQSFIFKGGVSASQFYEVDRDKKTYWKESIKNSDRNISFASMKPPPEMVSARMTSPNVATVLDTEKIAFSRLKSGFLGWGGDRVERVGEYECKIYSVSGVDFVTRTRTEHMTEDDCLRFKADKQAARESMPSFLQYLEQEEDSSADDSKEDQSCTLDSDLSIVDYFSVKKNLKRDVGVKKKMSSKSQKFSATLGLCDNFPLSLQEQVLPIIKLMANNNSHFAKLRDFITLQLPAGFPVKIEIPLFRILNARVTFSNLNGSELLPSGVVTYKEPQKICDYSDGEGPEMVTKCLIDKSIFELSLDYSELGTHYDIMQDHRDEEDELLQLAIQQSLINDGLDPTENVTALEALGHVPRANRYEDEGLRRAIEASLMTDDVPDSVILPESNSINESNPVGDDVQLRLALEASKLELSVDEQRRLAEEEELQRIIQLSLADK